MKVTGITEDFGNTDIYLLDAILKGYFDGRTNILDVGCGEGRNLIYFLKNNFEVQGIDKNESCIRLCKMMAKSHQPDPMKYYFQVGDARALPFESNLFEGVLNSALMHFAKNESEFLSMMNESTRVLKKGGIFFVRMASEIGINLTGSENRFSFHLTRDLIDKCLKKFNLEKLEPIKSVNVEDKRSMTTLLLTKK